MLNCTKPIKQPMDVLFVESSPSAQDFGDLIARASKHLLQQVQRLAPSKLNLVVPLEIDRVSSDDIILHSAIKIGMIVVW